IEGDDCRVWIGLGGLPSGGHCGSPSRAVPCRRALAAARMRSFRPALKSPDSRRTGRQQTCLSQRPEAIDVKKPLTEVPIIAAQNKIEIDISPATRAYSITVAPERSALSAICAERIRPIITSIPGDMNPLLEGKT